MNRTMARSGLCLMFAVTLCVSTSCSKKKAEAPAAEKEAAQATPEAPTPPPAPSAPEAKAPTAPSEAKPTPSPTGKAASADTPTVNLDRAGLEKAFLDIWCAQRKGETEKLLDIYTKHGFDDPKAWTEAWTEAAKDGAWVATITQDAMRQCP